MNSDVYYADIVYDYISRDYIYPNIILIMLIDLTVA